jgi:cell division transport system permease protein
MASRLSYFLHAAFAGMVRARALTLASTLTLAAALLVMGAFAMALHHGRNLARAWGHGGHISCAIASFVPEDSWPSVQDAVAALPGVQQVQLVPPEAAMAAFCAKGKAACALLEGVDPKLLPAALHVTPMASMVAEGAIDTLAQRMGAVTGVEDVAYGETKLSRVRAAMRTGALMALSLGALLCAAMVFMVSNTIRLMIYARQDEVRILRLVGATRWFVRAPFLIEGLTWGLCAGALGALGLWGVQRLFEEPLVQAQAILGYPGALSLFCWPLLLAQMATGALLGLMGSLLALHRFLDEDVG